MGRGTPALDRPGFLLSWRKGPALARISVQNTGSAAWADRDLMIEMQTRERQIPGVAVFENVYLGGNRGQTMDLDHPLFELEPPYDACVVIDPWDEVLEFYESVGAMVHNPICPDLPDLIVDNVYFGSVSGNTFNIDVKNIGSGNLPERTLVIEVRDGENQLLADPYTMSGFTLADGQSRRIEVPAGAVARNQLRQGYSVTVNPEGVFTESNFENNTLQVSAGTELELDWFSAVAPYHLREEVDFHTAMPISFKEGRGLNRLWIWI